VVYGSIDFGKTVVSHDKYKELVRARILYKLFISLYIIRRNIVCKFHLLSISSSSSQDQETQGDK